MIEAFVGSGKIENLLDYIHIITISVHKVFPTSSNGIPSLLQQIDRRLHIVDSFPRLQALPDPLMLFLEKIHDLPGAATATGFR